MSLHTSETIRRDVVDVYRYASDPSRLPEWAAGLSGSIEKVDGQWVAESPLGRVSIQFAPANDVGVLDHVVVLSSGEGVDDAMCVIPFDDVSEVIFTLRRTPAMSDDDFARDEGLVRADLWALKTVLEQSG